MTKLVDTDMKIVVGETGAVNYDLNRSVCNGCTQLTKNSNEIAVGCDKYALRKCLIVLSFLWSQPCLDSVKKDDLESCLSILAIFQNEDAFTQITKHIILSTSLLSSSTMFSLSSISLEEAIPDDIIRRLRIK